MQGSGWLFAHAGAEQAIFNIEVARFTEEKLLAGNTVG